MHDLHGPTHRLTPVRERISGGADAAARTSALVVLRDVLTCVVLLLTAVLLAGTLVLGVRAGTVLSSWERNSGDTPTRYEEPTPGDGDEPFRYEPRSGD